MKKNYQTAAGRAGTTGRTTPKKAKADPLRSADESAVTLPDAVSVAVGELAGELEEGLLAFAVGCGPAGARRHPRGRSDRTGRTKGRHDPQRSAVRHGSDDGLSPWAAARCRSPGPGCARPIAGRGGTAHLRAVHSTEVLGAMAMEAHAGQGVHPPLRRRPRAVGTGVEARSRTSQVGGVAALRGRHRDRPGRATGPGPLGARPRGPHGRRGPFRRSLLCRGPRHRPRRHQAPPGAWSRATPRTPPWSKSCWWGCATGDST